MEFLIEALEGFTIHNTLHTFLQLHNWYNGDARMKVEQKELKQCQPLLVTQEGL